MWNLETDTLLDPQAQDRTQNAKNLAASLRRCCCVFFLPWFSHHIAAFRAPLRLPCALCLF